LVPDRLNGIGERSPVVEASVHGLKSGYAWESGFICTVGHVGYLMTYLDVLTRYDRGPNIQRHSM
jgi:hypothetical protein